MHNQVATGHVDRSDAPNSAPDIRVQGRELWAPDTVANGLADWSESLMVENTPAGLIESALLGLIIRAADRLRRAMAASEEQVGDVKRLREESAAQRAWSRSIADWRRHKAAVAAADRAATRARGGSRIASTVELSESNPTSTGPVANEWVGSSDPVEPSEPTPTASPTPITPPRPSIPDRSRQSNSAKGRDRSRQVPKPSAVGKLPIGWRDSDVGLDSIAPRPKPMGGSGGSLPVSATPDPRREPANLAA